MSEVKEQRRRGATRISSKNQITIPVEALSRAGIGRGDRVRATAVGPGRIILEREADPIDRFAGALTGIYGRGYLDRLRREWP